MAIPYERPKPDMLRTGARDLLTRWIWWVMWSLSFLLPVSKKRDSLTRWAWGIAFAALGTSLLWYAIQCVVEAGTNTTGGYVSYEDWGEWVAPARYWRHKFGEAFGAMFFVGICAYLAHALLTGADDYFTATDDSPRKMHKSYFIRRDTERGACAGTLGCTFLIYEGPYLDAGWKRIERKTARALAKQPPGRYFYTVGQPDKFCSQRDYLSFVRYQKREQDIAVLVDTQ